MTAAIRELTTPKELAGIYPLIRTLNPKITKKTFASQLRAMREKGYRCIAAFDGGEMVGLCGIWTGTKFWCGDYIEIDNFIVREDWRGSGIGKALVAWVEEEGRRLGCRLSMLDSYVTAHHAHRFYFKAGYVILGYHLTKEL